jgi:hypothetical protein
MPIQSRKKGGDCGCNANHAIGSPSIMSGGSGYLNPASFSSMPADSYYQYNTATGTSGDPTTTGVDGNLISARNLPNMSSTGGGKKRRKKGLKGGNNNEIMNSKINDYMTNTVAMPDSTMKGGNAHTYNNDNLESYARSMDKLPYTPVSGGKRKSKRKNAKRKSKRKSKKSKRKSKKSKRKGGNLSHSLFNQMSNPISSFGTTSGAYTSANILSSNGQSGDSAAYNQPAATGYGANNPYLI